MMSSAKYSMLVLLALLMSYGCSRQPEIADGDGTALSPEGMALLVDREPADAMPVGEARKRVEDGQSVALVGIIGGSVEPFIDGLAAFTIVDAQVPYCPPEEGCPTPWDYCCTQDQVAQNIATVKLVSESQQPIAQGAKQLVGLKELDTVVVSGVAHRDEQGNLSLSAREVFIKK